MPFSSEELARYQRHLSLAGFGPDAQAALQRARVLVIGAGGLGCPALLYLAAAGVGHLTIIDPDTVDASNLQRQILFTTADVGQPKATVAAARLRALNPLIEITPHVARFTRDNALALVAAHDVVLDGSDNFATRYLVNDACVLGNKPLFTARSKASKARPVYSTIVTARPTAAFSPNRPSPGPSPTAPKPASSACCPA